MSNLRPTPIVDKNGVASTRHKKAAPSPATPTGIPAPVLDMAKAKREKAVSRLSPAKQSSGNIIAQEFQKLKRRKGIKSLVREIFADLSDVHYGMSRDSLDSSVDLFMTTAEVEKSIELVRMTKRAGVPPVESKRDRENLLYLFRTTMGIQRNGALFTDLHTHSDWLINHPGELHKLSGTLEDMAELGMLSPDGESRIEHIDDFIAARHHLAYVDQDIAPSWRKDYYNAAVRYPERLDDVVLYLKARNGFVEDGFEDFMSAAEKHPDELDKMVDYMRGRHGFDEDGFEQYLNTSVPLADGAL